MLDGVELFRRELGGQERCQADFAFLFVVWEVHHIFEVEERLDAWRHMAARVH
jgi:hypothetical protein